MHEPSPQFIEELSHLKRSLKPPDLTPDIFPSDLDVIDFDPNGKFRIRTSAAFQRIAAGLFSLAFFLGAGTAVGNGLGALLGMALWVWRARLGVYVSINLAKKTHAVVTPTSGQWGSWAPDVEIQLSRKGDKWKTTLVIGELEVIERISQGNSTYPDLEMFANALNSRLGRPVQIKVADGVYVSPNCQ